MVNLAERPLYIRFIVCISSNMHANWLIVTKIHQGINQYFIIQRLQ